ncbi:methyltransferase domain-containing protein [Dermacoccus nishinomiyaensis]
MGTTGEGEARLVEGTDGQQETVAARAEVRSGDRGRIDANLAAIRVVQRLEDSGEAASAEDARVLAGWTSWGAVPQIFDEQDTRFASEREQLRELLDASEWKAARRTVLNAHYTANEHVQPMWDALIGLGFDGGQVLEPGCGSGQFLAAAPAQGLAAPVRLTGVELDPMTARIAQALNPRANVRAESFAASPFADDTFDAVIGNVPFGKVALYDPQHNAGKHSIHNHFILKSLDLTRPGGMVAVLTSRYTLDARDSAARAAMFERADLVGAVRLPTGAHRKLAGTEAVTDLVILRKRAEGQARGDDSWVYTSAVDLVDRDGDAIATQLNDYWSEHPEQVLGQMRLAHGMYNAHTLTVDADEAKGPLAEQFAQATARVVAAGREHGMVLAPRQDGAAVIDADAVVESVARTGDITTFEGHLDYDEQTGAFTRVTNGVREPFEVRAAAHVRPLAELIGMRDVAVQLLDAEASSIEDTPQMERLRAELNTRYDAYVAKYGPLGKVTISESSRLDKNGDPIVSRRYPGAMALFRRDPHRAVVTSLEEYDEKTGTAIKRPIMHGRVVSARVVPTHADTPADALAMVWDAEQEVNLERIGALLGVDAAQARRQLGTLVYDEPEGGLVPAAQYLSGDVRAKLKDAQNAAAHQPAFKVNVEALRQVVPRDLGPDEITVRLGAVWVPREDVEAFLQETLDDPGVRVAHGGGSAWKITAGSKVSQKAVAEWGTERLSALDLAGRLMTQKAVAVHDTIQDGDSERQVLNAPETEAAKAKARALQEEFNTWVWADPQRAERLTTRYNELFNAQVLRDYTADGQRLALPGLISAFDPHPHQRTAVARIINEPSVGLYHGVGAGKTAEMVMGAMELGRLGLVNKPAVIVPNHMLEQVTTEWLGLYPNANVLAAGSGDLAKDGRRDFIAKAATGAWDGIVMTQGAFQSLDVSRATREQYRDSVLSTYHGQLQRLQASGDRNMTTKRMERALQKFEQRLEKQLDLKHDPGLTFEQTGIDYLLVDELHMYKNRTIVSNIQDAAKEGTDRATDLDMKLTYLRQRAAQSGRSPRVMTGATATPIPNSMSEAYIMQTYLRPDLLEEAGLTDFDAWAATFGESVTELEVAPEGGFRSKTRFARFNNLPELMRMWHISADVKTSAELALNVPLLSEQDGQRGPQIVAIEPSEELVAFMEGLEERAERIKTRQVEPTQDNMLKLSSHGRWAGLDMRLVPDEARPDMGAQDQLFTPPTKTDVAAERIHAIWQANRDNIYRDAEGEPHPRAGGFQIVFSDMGTPSDSWNAYDAIRDRLVELGMDRSRIQFVHDANTVREERPAVR